MKILILEDRECRVVQFKKNLISNEVTVVDVADDAIKLLKNKKWDILFLDNDLGDETNVPVEQENSGCGVARWLAKNVKKQPDIIIIHSLNIVAQKYIHSALPRSVIMPFAWTLVSDEKLKKAYGEEQK